jgi:hypothetical protein
LFFLFSLILLFYFFVSLIVHVLVVICLDSASARLQSVLWNVRIISD